MLPSLSIAFTAGVAGAVVNTVVALAAAQVGLLPRPPATLPWLYQRLVWGGLFGLVLVAPQLRRRTVERGLVASLLPSLARLTVFAPPGGAVGLRTLVVVLALNAVWGVAAAGWYEAARGR